MYDGASAMAEAVIMATVITGRKRVVIAGTLHPDYRATVRTYLVGRDIELVETPVNPAEPGQDSRLLAADAGELVDEHTACLCVQQPNFLGAVEDLSGLAEVAHQRGALFVTAVDPIALGILETPGAAGADIVVGEGQPLGISVSFGGPYLGIFATREKHVRQMPGRIVGETRDVAGRRGFVLTLQTREQHIRRERATSNICTNQALCALAATVYLATLGKNGLRQVANLCLQKAHYAADRIASVPGFSVDNVAPFFKEFVVHCPAPVAKVNRALLGDKIIGGFDLGRVFHKADHSMLICVTETVTVDEIDRLVESLKQVGRNR
jgi:glycine dehydrogenase subunit 1